MKILLGLVGIIGWAFALLILFSGKEISAIHEIEAGVGVLIGCVCFGSAGIIEAINRLEKKN